MSVSVSRVFVNKDSWKFHPFVTNNLTKRDDYKPEGLDVRLYVDPQFCRRTRRWNNKKLCIIIGHSEDAAHTIAFSAVVRYKVSQRDILYVGFKLIIRNFQGKVVEKCSLATTVVNLPYRHTLECLSVEGLSDMRHAMEVSIYSVSMSPTACDFRQFTDCKSITLDREAVPEPDFVIKAGDSVSFNAHRIILAAQSKYMRALIYGPYEKSNGLDWTHHSAAVVRAYLNLLYNPLRTTDLDTVENLADLYALTDMSGDHHYHVRLALTKCFLKCEEIAPLVELFRFLILYSDTQLVTILTCHLNCLFDINAGTNDLDDVTADLASMYGCGSNVKPDDYHLFNTFNAYATTFLLSDSNQYDMAMRRSLRCTSTY